MTKTAGETVLGGKYEIIQPLIMSQGWLCVAIEDKREVVFVTEQEDVEFEQLRELDKQGVMV